MKKFGFTEWDSSHYVRKEGLHVILGEEAGKPNENMVLQVWKEGEEYHLSAHFATAKVRALEFIDYILGDMGVCRGSAQQAQGKISVSLLNFQMEELEIEEPKDYFLQRCASYFEDCQEVWAETYAEQASRVEEMSLYQKRMVPWAYVKSMDIAPEGSSFQIRTLENESGVELVVSEDLYIMVGERGEVYHILREKFEKTYEPTEERLDVFAQMVEFLPEVEVGKEHYVSLDNLAKLCYPKKGGHILAKQLQQRTRVYPKESMGEYFLGQIGDYLVMREDDQQDIYIVQQDVFRETYEEV